MLVPLKQAEPVLSVVNRRRPVLAPLKWARGQQARGQRAKPSVPPAKRSDGRAAVPPRR